MKGEYIKAISKLECDPNWLPRINAQTKRKLDLSMRKTPKRSPKPKPQPDRAQSSTPTKTPSKYAAWWERQPSVRDAHVTPPKNYLKKRMNLIYDPELAR